MNTLNALHKVVQGNHFFGRRFALSSWKSWRDSGILLKLHPFDGSSNEGETVEELTGAAEAMRLKAFRVPLRGSHALDTCGTGGDGANTFNISTTVAFVAAAAGISVAKHGNRSVSSLSGSADVLESLGVHIHLSPEKTGACVDEVGLGFLFAPAHHPAMKHAAPIRRSLGFRTLFNLVGP